MNSVDYLIIGVLFISMLLGFFRGFVREAIGVIAWLGGVWLAWRHAPKLEPFLGGMVGEPPVSTWTARTLIVIGVLLVGWLIAALLGYVLRHSGLSILVDRVLGSVFGLVRGAVIVAVLVMLGEFVELQEVGWWKQAQLLPYAAELAGWIETFAETGMEVLDQAATTAAVERFSTCGVEVACAA